MTMPRRGLRTLLVVLAVLGYLAVAVAFVLQPGSRLAMTWIADVSLTGAAVLAGVASIARGRRLRNSPRARITWYYFAAAALSWGFGALVECWYDLVRQQPVPSPSLADLGYLPAGVLFAIGLLRMALPGRNPAEWLRTLVDGLMIFVAVLLVGWVSVVGPAMHLSSAGLVPKALLLTYAAVDVALITLAVHLVLRVRGFELGSGLPIGPLVAGVVIYAVADTVVAYRTLAGEYQTGQFFDAGWLTGFTLLLIGTVMPQRERRAPRDMLHRQIGLLLPYFFIVAATALSVIIPEFTGTTYEATRWIRSSLILLMVVRQLLLMQENQHLTRDLEKRVVDRTRELNASHKRFKALVENSSDVVTLIDRDNRIVYSGDSVARVFGLSPTSLVGLDYQGFLDEPSRRTMAAGIAEISGTPLASTTFEAVLVFPDGRRVSIENTVTNLLDDPAVQAVVVNSRDISERRQLEDELVHQAFHDSLTGLANRALFLDRVEHATLRRTTSSEAVGVLFLDLDGFKEVNDSLGHATGDSLLVDVARRLTSCLRPGDTIARLGGDEFAVLVEGALTGAEFIGLAGRIRESLEEPIVVDGRDLFIRASIGIASAEVGTVNADQLIRNADLAMYQAKERQDGEPALYDPSMHSSLVERLALEAELRKAVTDQGLQVHYQPTYGIHDGELAGVEALVRWPHPERGMIPPDVFIPLAEQTGLIHELGRFVLREACFQGREWATLSPSTALSIGVNVSGKQLQRRDFAGEVSQALADSGLSAEHLVLEMTESVLMNDTESTLRTLEALKAMGVRIAIDDFGTGYSSLSYLHRFPVDILKIDRSFVERLSGTDAEDSLVQSIVQLGQTLQLETIAEGIEEPGQLLALRRLGCTMAQGYHFGRPGPADVVSRLMVESAGQPAAAVPAG
ncbi:EAL domain-containing protein [Kineosporia sp. J2-2]|uniref:EAL domain-containing protein n=1 Tax=Kineosporia corallincola TaxID=2835133 RepID=A0ABS5TSS7_9ACTN|nr:bifunctional diguanylate cyclase/phosphodiesterase [Kineosporia corallincola]MBT0773837.1 EAL domain-containing protein [Kineosporia corallincola]